MRSRTNIAPLVCLGDPLTIGGVADTFDLEGELFLNPFDRRRVVYGIEVDHGGFTNYRALMVSRLRSQAVETLRIAAEREATPLGGVFRTLDDRTPLGVTRRGTRVGFNVDIRGGQAGNAILFAR